MDIRKKMKLGSGDQQSAYAARKNGDWPRIERLLRSCLTVRALNAVWLLEKAVIEAWPAHWQELAEAEHGRCLAELSKKKSKSK